MQKYVIVTFLEPVSKGAEFSASKWPLHITLAPNFVVDWKGKNVSKKLSELLAKQKPVAAVAGDDEYFGPQKQTQVTVLNMSPELQSLHHNLISLLKKNFPDDLKWFKAEISREEIGNLRYVDYSYWIELTDHTHLVKDAVKNIQNGKVVVEVSNDRFLEVAEQIRQGNVDFEPMILWGKDEHSPLIILEGHLRATAFGLADKKAPKMVRAIVGLQNV